MHILTTAAGDADWRDADRHRHRGSGRLSAPGSARSPRTSSERLAAAESLGRSDGAPPLADTHLDRSALDAAIVSQHLVSLYRYVCALGADSEQARDLCQEAFVVAWRKRKQQLPPAALASFLQRSARFAWLQLRRKDRRQETAVLREVDAIWTASESDDDHGARVAAVRACVAQLNGRAAEAVRCTYGLGHGREQVAAALGMKPNGVKTLLARTRRWLARCVEGRQS